LGCTLEAAGGDLLLELVELSRRQYTRVDLVLQRTKSLKSFALVKSKPVLDGTRAKAQQRSDLLSREAVSQPQQGGKAIVNPDILLLAAKLFYLFAYQGRQRELACSLLHCRFSFYWFILAQPVVIGKTRGSAV